MSEALPLLQRSRFVLVHPFFPENVGAVARSMHAFGLEDLRLVEGRGLSQAPAALASALAGQGLLAEAEAKAWAWEEAIPPEALSFATTNRHGKRKVLGPEEAAALAARHAGPVVVAFGNEKNGLSDAEIARCDLALRIPTRGEGGSLNLAQAATVVAHAWAQAAGHPVAPRATGKQALVQGEALEARWALLAAKAEGLGLWAGASGPRRLQSLRGLLARLEPNGEELEALVALLDKLGQVH